MREIHADFSQEGILTGTEQAMQRFPWTKTEKDINKIQLTNKIYLIGG